VLAWVAFVVFLVGTVLFLVVMAVRSRRMAAGLPGVAARLGLTYEAKDPFDLLASGYTLLQRGHSRRVSSVMHGTFEGRDVRVFGFFHIVGGGRGSQGHAEACVLVRVPTLGFWFRVEPWGRYGAAKPLHVPVLTGDRAFDRAWAVDSPDDTTTSAVLSPAFRSWLTARPERPYLGAGDGWVLVAARGQKPARLAEFIREAIGAADQVVGAPAATVTDLLASGKPDDAVKLLAAVAVSVHGAGDVDLSLRAAVLEAHGDALATHDPAAARDAYRLAAQVQRAFAADATAGGEGLARTAAADALDAKA